MSWTPAASRMGRTAPPAMTPVPGTAGFRNTRPAPKCPVISQGIVVSFSGTKIRSFLACSTALRIASGTSCALPRPTPTWPRPSPTTTSAVNENRRPPLTTLATRLMETTRSFNSSTLGSIFASATQLLLALPLSTPSPRASGPIKTAQMLGAAEFPTEAYAAYAAGSGTRQQRRRWAVFIGPLKFEAAGARRVGQGFDPPVVLEAAAIEHHAREPRRLGPLGQQRADRLGGCHVA